MSAGVFTPNLRVTFVEKDISEVGSGRAYPAAVTLDQIAEIYYRVKAFVFSGGMSWTYDDGMGGVPMTFSSPTSMPTNRTVEDGSAIQTRGYSMPGADTYNDAVYDAGNGTDYSDIGDNERGMWRSRWNEDLVAQVMYEYITHTCVTAFTYSANNAFPPDSTWWGFGEAGGFAMARIGRTVAVVKTNPANGFFDPTNLFYIEFEFAWFDYATPVNFGGWTNIYDGIDGDVSAGVSAAGNYTIRLHSGDILIPIYQGDIDSYSHACTVIQEAAEWWPYAKGVPPTAVWDTATGAKL